MRQRFGFGIWSIMLLSIACSGCGPAEDDAIEQPAPMCGEQGAPPCDSPDNWPSWQLEDVQPDSPRFGQTYGLDVFDGRVVFVAFLVGWCPYCQRQTVKLELLREELEREGVDVVFVTVNGTSANNQEDQSALTSRCSFPVLQDTDAVGAWTSGQGGKDDFFIYAPDGTLLAHLPPSSGTNLSEEEDYAALKSRLVEAASGE